MMSCSGNNHFCDHHPHCAAAGGGGDGALQLHTVRIYTKAEDNYTVTVRNGEVVLALANHMGERHVGFPIFFCGRGGSAAAVAAAGGGVAAAGGDTGGVSPHVETVRIYSKADDNYSLTVRNGEVVLAPANPRDEYQHWVRHSSTVKDEEGILSFALVNKATGQAIKHSIG